MWKKEYLQRKNPYEARKCQGAKPYEAPWTPVEEIRNKCPQKREKCYAYIAK